MTSNSDQLMLWSFAHNCSKSSWLKNNYVKLTLHSVSVETQLFHCHVLYHLVDHVNCNLLYSVKTVRTAMSDKKLIKGSLWKSTQMVEIWSGKCTMYFRSHLFLNLKKNGLTSLSSCSWDLISFLNSVSSFLSSSCCALN